MQQISSDEALKVRDRLAEVKTEIGKAIVGHEEVIEEILICLMAGGHALVEGVPGLGKTYLIKTLGEVLDLTTSRIQFTPDLMPADILGTNILIHDDGRGNVIQFQKGPIFAQILLADEINRATPKTQSALLEAMQEQKVTIGGVEYLLETPFIVLATQNPIEMEGTYPLPEAQLDRFFFKLKVNYPSPAEVSEIIDRTTQVRLPVLEKKINTMEIKEMQRIIREIPVPDQVKDYAVRLVFGTHPAAGSAGNGKSGKSTMTDRYVRYGSSPRGAQSLILAGKVFAIMDGRFNVSFEDIRRAANPALRHRLILSFEGEAEGISQEEIINDIIRRTPEEDEKA